jgi:hypothetical protein
LLLDENLKKNHDAFTTGVHEFRGIFHRVHRDHVVQCAAIKKKSNMPRKNWWTNSKRNAGTDELAERNGVLTLSRDEVSTRELTASRWNVSADVNTLRTATPTTILSLYGEDGLTVYSIRHLPRR